MSTIQLELPYILSGVLSLIGVSVSILLGSIMILKYFKHKRKELIMVGATSILIGEPWWPSAFGFLSIVLTGQNLAAETQLILGVVLLPLLAIAWLSAFTELVAKKNQKQILLITVIVGIIFEILFFTLFTISPNLIGDISGYFDPNYGIFVRLFEFLLMACIGLSGILFARMSLRSENEEIRLKGKIFIAAIICFLIGGSLDIAGLVDFPNPSSIVMVIAARSIMMVTSFLFYISFILPERVKKLFIKAI